MRASTLSRRAPRRAISPANLLFIAAGLALAPACTARVNAVDLVLRTSRGPVALLCREGTAPLGGPGTMPPGGMGNPGMSTRGDAGALLISRARSAGSARVVLDYFGINGGVPGCLPDSLIDHCTAHCCPSYPSQRVCIDVTLADAATRSDLQLADDLLASLRGRVATHDAPDGYVLVRVVVTTETCAELEPTDAGTPPEFDSTKLVGCAFSCPVRLDEVPGSLSLGLPALGDQCGASVDSCAHEFERLATSGCAGAAGR